MEIILLDIDKNMTLEWQKEFAEFPEVKIVNEDFIKFMNNNPDVDGIVSPANSFGLMDGGYDKAIIELLGPQAQTNVFCMLDVVYNGYQPVGTALLVPFDKYFIIHTPTMRTPEEIIDTRVIFDCMYQCLNTAYKGKVNKLVIPAFGGCTGKVPKDTIAKYMAFAYRVFLSRIGSSKDVTSWGFALHIKKKLDKIYHNSVE